MRLKYTFVTMDLDGMVVAVPTDGVNGGFDGGIRLNKSAAVVFELLQNDVTEEELVASLAQKYAAPKELLREDLRAFLNTLRQKGLVEE